MRPFLAALAFLPGLAFADCTDDAMLVFDASGSMAETGYDGLDEPRITDARQALRLALPKVTPLRRIGLIVYGPGETESCSHVDLRLRPAPDAADRILAEIDALSPEGNTALTQAVRRAAETLDYRARAGTVVLVTDGKETCGGATCQLATDLADEARDLTIHVIGFRVRGAAFNWGSGGGKFEDQPVPAIARCLAEKTGGLYVSTETVEDLVAALRKTLGCPLFSNRAPEMSILRTP